MRPQNMRSRTAVVTGGSRGLGLGVVEALVDQGAKVTVVARGQAALAAVKQRLGVAVIAPTIGAALVASPRYRASAKSWPDEKMLFEVPTATSLPSDCITNELAVSLKAVLLKPKSVVT